MTPERAQEIIDGTSDDDLIDFATTCSNRGIALAAEIHLRERYPSKLKMYKPPKPSDKCCSFCKRKATRLCDYPGCGRPFCYSSECGTCVALVAEGKYRCSTVDFCLTHRDKPVSDYFDGDPESGITSAGELRESR